MKLFVGVTDNRWFEFLAARDADEVNFWRPRSRQGFKAVQVGEPFLFKLHHPLNFIVGGGFLVRHSVLPISLAWKAFGEKNGTHDFETFRKHVVELGQREEHDPHIGCTILGETFFFSRDEWIQVPPDWSKNIVVGKGYDTASAIGLHLWQDVEQRLMARDVKPTMLVDGPR